MHSKASIAALVFAGMAVAALPAAAQDSGFYLGGSIGYAKARNVCTNATKCDDNETGYKGFGGYQINKTFSAEAGYQYFSMFGRNGQGIATSALDVTALASLPLPIMDKLSVYGRAGGYMASTKSKPLSEDNGGFTYGVGLEYGFARDLSGRFEWQRYNNVGGGTLGFNTDIDVLSLGVVWRLR